MKKDQKLKHKGAFAGDIIEIVPSPFPPKHPIGRRYVVVGRLDTGFDVEIINEHGAYDIVNEEDYVVVGNTSAMREAFWENIRNKQGASEWPEDKSESASDMFAIIIEGLDDELSRERDDLDEDEEGTS